MDNAIVPTPSNGKLAEFGQRDDIREMSERLQKMLPGAVKFTPAEALTVAQVAIAHHLDPFNGEVWGLKGNDDKWRGVMVGIKGLRKHARSQADKEGGTYWIEFRNVKPEIYGATAQDLVYEAHLRDTVNMQAYGRSINILTTSGVPYGEAAKMLGPAPEVVGVGIVRSGEQSKMQRNQLARKRAEADAIKQRYDISFGDAVVGDEETGATLEGEFTVPVPEIPAPVQTTAQSELPKLREYSQDEIMQQLGFDQ